ncbi:hypothetical protein L9F63_024934 [Diploptera punctata]|uniref:Serpin domain-containing protein n=1 Tax=Diploptera punctata TaxID=6984 RepID=A0AAD7ZED1_DIPPU|nr:hypothetical protein L9F63_024934 [Diploptera punctata]
MTTTTMSTFPNSTQSENNNSTILTRYGEITSDRSIIRFQYEESAEVGNAIWDSHIEKIISHGILQLALHLQYVLRTNEYKEQLKDNLVFSPTNIAAALAMVMLGSAGKTYTEIANVLGLLSGVDVSANSDEIHYNFGRLLRKLQAHSYEQMPTTVTIAGAVFVQTGYPIEETFYRKIWDTYASEIINVDFYSHNNEAKEVINRWVANRTYGRIPNILEYPPSQSSRVIIASALYFNGAWEHTFPPEQSKWKPFYIEGPDKIKDNEILQVIMMTTGAEFPYYHDNHLRFQAVGLPYKDHSATMFLILPDTPGLDALKQLEDALTVGYLHELSDLTTERTVIVAVPRMQLETTLHLKSALKNLGVISLFEPSQADLRKITSYRPVLYQTSSSNTNVNNISNVNEKKQAEKIEFRVSDLNENSNPGLYAEDIIHKVTIDVTELGTEASAASVVAITRDGTHKVVRFERPFLFFIQHKKTGMVLFWGKVVRPTPNQAANIKG